MNKDFVHGVLLGSAQAFSWIGTLAMIFAIVHGDVAVLVAGAMCMVVGFIGINLIGGW